MANESERSKVILVDANAKTENFIRSAHNDFATTAELKARKFDGWRHNKLGGVIELWVDGAVVRTVAEERILTEPDVLEQVFADYFAQH